ncbi:MAG: hypothetical protein HKN52_07415 [Eudoraea sp.]|nr:hypothetical protein [Eudoraea sp.]
MKKKDSIKVFIVLGVVWLLVGLVIYPNTGIWPLGFLFLIIGLILKYGPSKPKN